MMLSDVCLSVCCVHRPKSRTERPGKTKIGTEVAYVTRDSDTIFKVKRSRSQGRGHIVAASRTACYNCDSTAVRPDYDHSTFDILPHIFVWAAVIYFSTIHFVHLMGPACYNVTYLLLPAGWRFLMPLVTGSRPSRKCFFSRVSMPCIQSAILFYQFCLSVIIIIIFICSK